MFTYRLCSKHSLENQKKIEGFAHSRPDASVKDWEKFFGPNTEWQTRMMQEHCGDGSGLGR